MVPAPLRPLYLRWIGANALGELFGLGLTLLVGALFFLYSGEPRGLLAVLLAFAVAVSSGVIEATVVGLAQWWAMRPWFPRVERGAWWRGTLVGALAAYVLGYLPSTLMNLGEQAAAGGAAAQMSEPPQGTVLVLAAGLGLVAGAMLSLGQLPALRKAVAGGPGGAPTRGEGRLGAGWWIPANSLAWALGMPLIFWGIDLAQRGQPVFQSALIIAGVLLLTGVVVGAVHGLFLVRMVEKNDG